jgi:TPR repeat protein
MAFDVFISYPHQDKATADAACAALEAAKVRCWIAPRDVPAGANWAGAIVDAIDECRAVVLIFSSSTNRSKQIHREVQRAFDREKPVVPFRIENVAPEKGLAYYMGPVHWLDALTPPLEQHLHQLVASMRRLTQSEAAEPNKPVAAMAAPPPVVPQFWTAAKRTLAVSIFGLGVAVAVGFWFTQSHFPQSIVSRPTPAKTPETPAPPDPNRRVSAAHQQNNPATDIVAAANRGDLDAQNQLGVKYALGEDGYPHDDTKAVAWYRKAANQNFAKAETNLGDMYFYGRGGLSRDYGQALSWYLKAAAQGRPDAQYRLGYLYENGLGTDKDLQRAVQFYRSAADHGYAEAENMLGVLYATGGDDVAQDDQQAIAWYRKAAAQNDAKAQKNLGDIYFFGRGVAQDYQQAAAWYTKAANQQFPDAQVRLGYMYEKGLGLPQSQPQAVEQYQKAASNGSVEAQRALDRLSVK